MLSYLTRRLLLMIPALLGVTLVTFVVIHLAPGDPVSAAMGGEMQADALSSQAIEHFRKEMHLDDPLLVQYGRWIGRLATLDLGTSWRTGRSVGEQLAERLPVTMALGGASLFLVYLIGLPLGVMSAVRRGSLGDRATTLVLFVLYSLPSFWVGTLAILLLGGGRYWDWIPVQGLRSPDYESMSAMGQIRDVLWHGVTPVVMLGYASLASVSRYMRTGMLDVVRQDYVRTARAKGLSERVVIYKHALRNSLIPILSHLGTMVPFLLGGTVIVERLFGIPGMGQLMFQAILARDYSLIMGITTVTALLTMLAILVTDLLYAVVDPRISYGKK
ncbi:ABC transporter permease [Vulgatibacter incomptus]|uniref:Oligopeptide transport system permease protein OppB n=1 Tax=Vulgatibacter incomptus TaxID=1391653 RepID=A0A0K1PCB7_9BACT|nr:ABC transporter permease [Vulgatibacter incomptus]AKU91061.1 Oligopeptide transport system permease protein OppB [Vulgatibacter incomptus]